MARCDKLLASLTAGGRQPCLISGDSEYAYEDVADRLAEWREQLRDLRIGDGAIVALRADYSIDSISLLLALMARRCVAALVPPSTVDEEAHLEDCQAEGIFRFGRPDGWTWQPRESRVTHPLLTRLRATREPGFVIFSSGSTGRPKAVLHSAERFLGKFVGQGKSLRTLAFLLFDHIAGMDTLFYTLCSHGTLVLLAHRNPLAVCQAIEAHRVAVMPTSPAFLNLLCLSGDHEGHDLSSLKIITYGSEPMSQASLDRLCEIFSNARILQKYGTSELGSPRSLSRGNNSLWLKFKHDELDVRIVDNVLWVRSETTMLGYLNAPSPFDRAGWYCTGDLVERDGEWLHILGRESDVINVGGDKLHPQEVEDVIMELDDVLDAVVRGEAHPLMGEIVCAAVTPAFSVDQASLRKLVRQHCRKRLVAYKVPARIEVATQSLRTSRQKKIRR